MATKPTTTNLASQFAAIAAMSPAQLAAMTQADLQAWLTASIMIDGSADPNIDTAFGKLAGEADIHPPPLPDKIITLAKMMDVATGRFLLRKTAGTGSLELGTGTDATSLLDVSTPSAKGLQSAFDKLKSDRQIDLIGDVLGNVAGKFDGTTDITADLNAYIAALPVGGYQIDVTKGIYKLNTANVTANLGSSGRHIKFKGTISEDCVFSTAHATCDVFTAGEWYSSLEDVKLTSSVTRTGGYAVNIPNGMTWCTLHKVDIYNMFNGVKLGGHLSFIDDCNFRTFVAGGCWIEQNGPGAAHDNFIHKVVGDNGANAANTCGLLIKEGASLLVSESHFIHAGNDGGVYFSPDAGKAIPSTKFSQCFFDQCGIGANLGGNATGTIQRTTFTACSFSTNTFEGVKLNQENTQTITFLGCEFFQNGTHGLDAIAWKDCNIRSCTFAGNVTTGVRTAAGAGHSISVSDSAIGNYAGFGPNGLAVNIQAGTYQSYQVSDCRGFDTNTTPGLIDLGTATNSQSIVRDNLGALTSTIATLAAPAATSGNTETRLFGGRIPANAVKIGTTFRIRLTGVSSSTGTLIFRVRAGALGTTGDAQVWISTTSAAQVANARAGIDVLLVVLSIGPGTVTADGNAHAGAVLLPTLIGAPTAPAIVSTAPWFIDVDCTCSSGTFTARVGSITTE